MPATIGEHLVPPESGNPRRNPDYGLVELDGRLYLRPASGDRGFRVNATFALVWRLCDGQHSLAEILDLLVECFPDPRAGLELELIDIVDKLVKMGLVTVD